jgi:hypothetical protein
MKLLTIVPATYLAILATCSIAQTTVDTSNKVQPVPSTGASGSSTSGHKQNVVSPKPAAPQHQAPQAPSSSAAATYQGTKPTPVTNTYPRPAQTAVPTLPVGARPIGGIGGSAPRADLGVGAVPSGGGSVNAPKSK